MPTQEIVKKAEDLRTFRGSSSFSGKTHALDQTFQGVRARFTLGDEQRFNVYMSSFYSAYTVIPTPYLLVI